MVFSASASRKWRFPGMIIAWGGRPYSCWASCCAGPAWIALFGHPSRVVATVRVSLL